MIRLLLYALASAASGAVVGYLLAGRISEGAIAGAVLGTSLGIIVAMRRNASSAGVSFELETAGIPDDNLITIARRDLSRDAYRDSYDLREGDAPAKASANAAGWRVQESGGRGPSSRDSAK